MHDATAVLATLSSASKVALGGHISLRCTPTCARRGRLGAGLLLVPPLRLQAIPAQAANRHAAGAVNCGQWPPLVQPTPVPRMPGEALRGHRCWPHRMGPVLLLLQPSWLPILRVGLLLRVLLQHDIRAGVLCLHTAAMLGGMQQGAANARDATPAASGRSTHDCRRRCRCCGRDSASGRQLFLR